MKVYDVLATIHHFSGLHKEPGDEVTEDELADAGQTDDDVKRLIKDGALKVKR